MLTSEQQNTLLVELQSLQKLVENAHTETADFNDRVLNLTADETGPKPLTPERFMFRIRACIEELTEAVHAYQRGDHGEVIDAFIDNSVFALGAIVEQNVPAGQCFTDVTNKNLEKKLGTLDKRPDSGGNDAVKPEGWVAPNHDWVFHLSPVAIEVAKLHAAKGGDYGHWSQYFPFGHTSFQQMLWMKMTRMMNLNPDTHSNAPNFESLRDTVLDMGNYCNFYAEWLSDPTAFEQVNKYGSKAGRVANDGN
jgi:predicted HAD superfamily Cof-like phosphohydrolase